ncbi:MAG: hypothetical protein ACLFUF_04420 [Opitutales bacterium]
MTKIYDKLLLLLALGALLAGAGYYYLQSGNMPSEDPQVETEPAANPYKPVSVTESESGAANWPEPSEQSHGPNWVYDVFTPPKIYLDEDGNFSAEPIEPPRPPEPFGVYLADIDRNLYRLQLQGYVREDRSDAKKSLILLADEEQNKRVRVRVGETVEDSEFEVLDFEIKREESEGGGVNNVGVVTLRDMRTDETIELDDETRRYEDSLTIVIRSTNDPSIKKEFSEADQRFEMLDAEYILESIDIENKSVTVTKLPGEDEELDDDEEKPEPETKVLEVRDRPPQSGNGNDSRNRQDEDEEEEEEEEEEEDDEESSGLDEIF